MNEMEFVEDANMASWNPFLGGSDGVTKDDLDLNQEGSVPSLDSGCVAFAEVEESISRLLAARAITEERASYLREYAKSCGEQAEQDGNTAAA